MFVWSTRVMWFTCIIHYFDICVNLPFKLIAKFGRELISCISVWNRNKEETLTRYTIKHVWTESSRINLEQDELASIQFKMLEPNRRSSEQEELANYIIKHVWTELQNPRAGPTIKCSAIKWCPPKERPPLL